MVGYNSEASLVDDFSAQLESLSLDTRSKSPELDVTLAGVIFARISADFSQAEYKLRFPASLRRVGSGDKDLTTWRTDLQFAPWLEEASPGEDQQHANNGRPGASLAVG